MAGTGGERVGSGSAERRVAILLPLLAALPAILSCWTRYGDVPWWDEVFSLWASDPAVPFAAALRERIFPDSNPPLYFSLLHAVRSILAGPDAAVIAINGFAIATAVAIVVTRGTAGGRAVPAALAVAAFLTCGPMLAMVDEARAYGIALSITVVAAWLAIEAADPERAPPPVAAMALVGALAAVTHVFAAIACGALAAAAGLVTLGDVRRRWPALVALGGAATLVTAGWLAANAGSAERVQWIRFDAATVRTENGLAAEVLFGDWRVAFAAAAVLAAAALDRRRRPVAVTALTAWGLFLLLPILASFVQPLVAVRYLTVGSPIVIVGLALVVPPVRRGPMWRGRIVPLLAAALLTWIAVVGLPMADRWRERTAYWHGGPIVRAALQAAEAQTGRDPAALCPAGSIRTSGPLLAIQDEPWVAGLSLGSGLPADRFVVIRPGGDAPAAPALPAAETECPVIGWIEHVFGAAAQREDARVLAMLGLPADAPHGPIVRTGFGYVVPAP